MCVCVSLQTAMSAELNKAREVAESAKNRLDMEVLSLLESAEVRVSIF